MPDTTINDKTITLTEVYDKKYSMTYFQELQIANYVRYQIFKEIMRKIKLGEIVLDFGCGGGQYIPLFAEYGANVIGIDISRVAIRKAKSNKKYRSPENIHFILADGEKLPLRNDVFDVVFITEVLEHLLNPIEAVKESSRVLKKGGIIICSVPCGNKYSVEWFITWLLGGSKRTKNGFQNFWPDWGTEHLQRFTNREIEKLYFEQGVRMHFFAYYDHLFHHLCKILALFKKSRYYFLRGKIECLDYKFFKKIPNGTGMVFLGSKFR